MSMEEEEKILTVARDYRSDRRDERWRGLRRERASNAFFVVHRRRSRLASIDAVDEFDHEYTPPRWLELADHRQMAGWLEEVCRL